MFDVTDGSILSPTAEIPRFSRLEQEMGVAMVRIHDVPTRRVEVVQTSIWRSHDKCYTRVVYINNALNEGGMYTTSAFLSSSNPLPYTCHP